MEIKKLLVINVPIKKCNLECSYCYIHALRQFEDTPVCFNYTPEHVGKCLSKERMGGICLINLTGGGETLLPKEMPQYIYHMLAQGHYLEVVTNGTLTKRFDEIASFPYEFLRRLEFKFSFHYAELKRKNLLDVFLANVARVRECGCSFTIELMPHDGLVGEISEIMDICHKEFGALCQLTVGRNDLSKNKNILTKMSLEDYTKTWEPFDSEMFNFKMDIFQKPITSFCYAGAWTLYIDLGTGMTKPCYGQLCNQNIFDDPDKQVMFMPVGNHCRQPYCYNGHAFLCLGVVPEMETPTYADIRNRICDDGSEWLSKDVKDAFSTGLERTNRVMSDGEKRIYELKYPLRLIQASIFDRKNLCRFIKRKIQKNSAVWLKKANRHDAV